jgi:hypothetical protein
MTELAARRGDWTDLLGHGIEDINLMTMATRLRMLRELCGGPVREFLPGYEPRWRNIEGMLDFFRDHRLGGPGSWVSYVDAGILEGIMRGVAIATGHGTDTFGNPGATLWAGYLTQLRDGELTARSAHDRAWSVAEQASTEHGRARAELVHGLAATPEESRFYEFSEFYRWALRHRLGLLDVVSPPVGPGRQPQLLFLDWFTDVTNHRPVRRGAEVAHELAQYDIDDSVIRLMALAEAYTEALSDDYLDDTGTS